MTNRILEHDNDPDITVFDIMSDIEAVFEILDNREHDLGVATPNEFAVDGFGIEPFTGLAAVVVAQAQKNHGTTGVRLFDFPAESIDVYVGKSNHCQDEIELALFQTEIGRKIMIYLFRHFVRI